MMKKLRLLEYYMVDSDRDIYIYDYNSSSTYCISNKNNVWTDPAAISTYENVIKAYDWWKKYYKGIDGKGGDVNVYVHYEKFRSDGTLISDNAFYNDYYDTLKFCDNSKWAYTSGAYLNIVGHEYTHAVIQHKTEIGDNLVADTINEAYADIFGSFIDNDTWSIMPRDIANPRTTLNPDSVSSSYYDGDYKDTHTNSTIISHAAYLMAHKYLISYSRLHTLWYDSIREGYSDKSNFYTVRENVIKAARKNGFVNKEIEDIGKAFDEVGIKNGQGEVEIYVYDGSTPITNARVILSKYSNCIIGFTDSEGKTFITTDAGTNTVRVEIPGYEPLLTQVLVKKNKKVTKTINLITSKSNFTWKTYDHPNYSQPYVTPIPTHIELIGNDIKMIGYTVDPLKDLLLTSDIDGENADVLYRTKILSFSIKRDNNNWHTMEGGGFIFGASIDEYDKGKELLSGYCILVTEYGLDLYELNDVDINKFCDGELGNVCDIGKHLGNYSIGNVLYNHDLTLKINYDCISVWDKDKLIIDNYKLGSLYGGDFGPITSHISHDCDQVSYFTFSDIQMSSIYDY